MIKTLLLTSTSAAFEWQNGEAYYSPKEYKVYLDGVEVMEGRTNVFSLFGLSPATSYTLTADGFDGEIRFSTEEESCAVSLLEFGALGDGVTDNTTAIQTAINCLPEGGRLFIPKGIYLTAPLNIKSNVTIELDEGATLLGTPDRSRYPVIPGAVSNLNGGDVHFGGWEGVAVQMHQALIFASYAKNITIIGRGRIDGNGELGGWWQESVRRAPLKRPKLLFFNRCCGIRIHGVTVACSPSWNVHPYFSDNIDVIDVAVEAPKNSPNTDAIDPEACDRVDIIGCRLSVGDDCIAIKSGRIELARIFKRPASRHTVRNCLMEFGHGALTLGIELGGGVRDLVVERCVFSKTDRGLRIKTRRGRGKHSIVDGVLFENIKMDGVLTPIVINSFYHCDQDGRDEYVQTRVPLPIDDRTPYLGRFTFKSISCTDCEIAACYCEGLPERPIDSITLENVDFSFSEDAKTDFPAMCDNIERYSCAGMIFRQVRSLTLKNVSLNGIRGERLITSAVGSIEEK